MQQPRPYWNPFVAGTGIGLLLVLSYVVLGTGLGASGAIHRVAVTGANKVAPAFVEQSPRLSGLAQEGRPMDYYLVYMLGGILIGGLVSSIAASRFRAGVERGPGASRSLRLALALAGGALVGAGGRLAQGCTSGLALSSGALLQGGAFAFIAAMFAAGFLVAPLVRKEWR